MSDDRRSAIEPAVMTLGCIVHDQIATLREVPVEKVDELLEADYAASLWEPGGKR